MAQLRFCRVKLPNEANFAKRTTEFQNEAILPFKPNSEEPWYEGIVAEPCVTGPEIGA